MSRLGGTGQESAAPITGHNGRAFRVTGEPSGRSFIADRHIFLVEQLFYKIIVAGDVRTYNEGQAGAFMTSFRLLPRE